MQQQIHLKLSALLLVTLLLSACGGGGGESGPTNPSGGNAAALTADGWEQFTGGNYAAAETAFTAALNENAGYGPALTGRAWTRLQTATSTAAFSAVVGDFNVAVGAGETGGDVLLGRAAARLGAGQWADARTDAQAVIALTGSYVFPHRVSLNTTDAHLVVAFSHVAQGDLAAALAAGESVQASGLDQGNPATWIVSGTTYASFNSALLAWLHNLSEGHAG